MYLSLTLLIVVYNCTTKSPDFAFRNLEKKINVNILQEIAVFRTFSVTILKDKRFRLISHK